jgi:hypothetical protein
MQKYSGKFYVGIALVVISLLLGKITTATLILHYQDSLIRWLSIAVYAISWPMLVVGVWWTGEEYAKAIKRYFSYKFYHEHAKKGGKRVAHHTREGRKRVVGHGKRVVANTVTRGKKVVSNTARHGKVAVAHGKRIRKNVNKRVKKVNSQVKKINSNVKKAGSRAKSNMNNRIKNHRNNKNNLKKKKR